MYKPKLLYNEEELFCTKTKFYHLKLTLSFARLVMVRARLTSNSCENLKTCENVLNFLLREDPEIIRKTMLT